MKSFFYRNFPILVIACVISLIIILNYSFGNFLTGGDNLHPELSFYINLKRSIFSVWQEYQGLGLLGGMGHAADFFRQLFLLPFSVILSVDQIRWFWTFLTLFLGSVGAYFLFLNLINKMREEERIKNQIIALIGALFYLLNLSTVQSYFTPFEVFTAHFAFLPWLLLITVNFFTKPNIKNLLLLGVMLLISTPAAYVPTLFVVYIISSFILGIFLIKGFRNFIKTYLKFILIVLIVNAFWLLPFLFFTFTNTITNVNAKINQMATDAIYMNNREFGHIWDVALLKGFWFNNVEPNLQGKYTYMLQAWKNHIDNSLITVLGFIIFLVVLFGLFVAIKKKNRVGLAMASLFIFSFIMLTTATPPFSWLNDFIRENVPLFGQIFRFPFTKFSILASLIFAFFFSYGVDYLLRSQAKSKLNAYIAGLTVSILAFIIFVFPIFTGNLFYEREKIKIPQEYFDTFNFFEKQNPDTRIANFPQHTFWGWNFYDWGYSGSGFIWYGIDQPILDRAFDVWNKNNENYFWELNHALYSKKIPLLKSVLDKYDVYWLLIDKNITNPASSKSLFIQEFETLMKDMPEVEKIKNFNKIGIYKYSSDNKDNKFISSIESLLPINSYDWSDTDQAYISNGDYYSKEGSDNSQYFPFREIFTGRSQKDVNFKVTESNNSIEFEKPLPQFSEPVNLTIPSFITQNNTLPINIFAKRLGNTIRINFVLQTAQVDLKNNSKTTTLWESKINKTLFEIPVSANRGKININGITSYEIPELKVNEEKMIGTTSLTITNKNILVLSDKADKTIDSEVITGMELQNLFIQNESYITLPRIDKDTHISIKIPKLNDRYSSFIIDPVDKVISKEAKIVNCDAFRKNYFSYFIREEEEKKLLELNSVNATPCISFYLPTLDHDQGYLLRIENKNLNEQGLRFWVLNEDQKTAVVDTYFERNKKGATSVIIIPPTEKYGKAYSLHFDNASIGNIKAANQLGKITIDPIPYYFLTNINIEKKNSKPETYPKVDISVNHPNQSLYLVQAKNPKGKFAISLSQSYSPYWRAYEVSGFNFLQKYLPFIFGTEIKNHLKINNWKNGWIIDSSPTNSKTSIIIVYLPQYLQYFGFVLSFGSIATLSGLYIYERKKRKN